MKITVQREKAINLRGFTEDNKRQKLTTSTSISNSSPRAHTSSMDGSIEYYLTTQGAAGEKRPWRLINQLNHAESRNGFKFSSVFLKTKLRCYLCAYHKHTLPSA
jgi:hypothetical protein